MKYTACVLGLSALLLAGCQSMKTEDSPQEDILFGKGTYGYDKGFLAASLETVELKNNDAAVLLVPAYQGRVMTSTCEGDSGFSFGWINYDLIASGKPVEHINPFGGEERFWIGPEGGQYSVYFEKDKSFDFENWFVPPSLDTEAFELVSQNGTQAVFKKEIVLRNYSATEFKLEVTREVMLLDRKQIGKLLDVSTKKSSVVAYESRNTLKNTGSEKWEKESGLLSIWMLGMLIPSPEVTVIIPVKEGSEAELGPQVNDDYFGKVSTNRLKVVADTVLFKADGKSRGKIGIPPLRATRYMGSYDGENQVLTILECILPEGQTDFVNSAWALQDNPYGGDALNSYNDGPLEDGSQMGPFYELESSSPALALKPAEAYTHLQRTYHFSGERSALNKIAKKVLGMSLDDVDAAF